MEIWKIVLICLCSIFGVASTIVNFIMLFTFKLNYSFFKKKDVKKYYYRSIFNLIFFTIIYTLVGMCWFALHIIWILPYWAVRIVYGIFEMCVFKKRYWLKNISLRAKKEHNLILDVKKEVKDFCNQNRFFGPELIILLTVSFAKLNEEGKKKPVKYNNGKIVISSNIFKQEHFTIDVDIVDNEMTYSKENLKEKLEEFFAKQEKNCLSISINEDYKEKIVNEIKKICETNPKTKSLNIEFNKNSDLIIGNYKVTNIENFPYLNPNHIIAYIAPIKEIIERIIKEEE